MSVRARRAGSGGFSCFSPLFIGLGLSAAQKEVVRVGGVVSVPYSSGLGLSALLRNPPSSAPNYVSVPYSSGLRLSGLAKVGIESLHPAVSVPYSSGLGLSAFIRRCNEGRLLVSVPHSSGLGLSVGVCAFGQGLALLFQSPIHRGLGCRAYRRVRTANWKVGFSPLFIGAWVVGRPRSGGASAARSVSVPYSSGLGLSDRRRVCLRLEVQAFQSPIHRGLGCRVARLVRPGLPAESFSPLFIGAWVVGVAPA